MIANLSRAYAPPGDALVLETNDAVLFSLADRLWRRSVAAPSANGRQPITIRVGVTLRESAAGKSEGESWTVTKRDAVVVIPDKLRTCVRFASSCVEAEVSRELLRADPSTVARLILEAPVAELLARRGWYVIHGAAVVNRGRGVVVRGRSGAGKSTLVAACWKRGLGILGDESILVGRADTDALSAAVREMAVLPDSAALVGFDTTASPAATRGSKYHVHLFDDSTPTHRIARRMATVLLGSRDRTPARLVPLDPETFTGAFLEAEIEQERWAGDPDFVAAAWSARRCYRLEGTADLEGAVSSIQQLLSGGADDGRP